MDLENKQKLKGLPTIVLGKKEQEGADETEPTKKHPRRNSNKGDDKKQQRFRLKVNQLDKDTYLTLVPMKAFLTIMRLGCEASNKIVYLKKR